MSVFLKAIFWGAIAGAIVGLALDVAEYFRAGGSYDEHGYATIALIIICAVLGAFFGAAGGVGAYLKKKFEGD